MEILAILAIIFFVLALPTTLSVLRATKSLLNHAEIELVVREIPNEPGKWGVYMDDLLVHTNGPLRVSAGHTIQWTIINPPGDVEFGLPSRVFPSQGFAEVIHQPQQQNQDAPQALQQAEQVQLAPENGHLHLQIPVQVDNLQAQAVDNLQAQAVDNLQAQAVNANVVVRLEVSAWAVPGDYPYAIEIEEGVFARGGSHTGIGVDHM